MKQKVAIELFKNLPAWAKGTIAVAIVGGIGLIGYRIYKFVQDKKGEQDSQDTVKGFSNEYDKLKKTQKLSYPEASYVSVANSVKNYLDGCDTYINEDDAVWSILSVVKKPIDWLFLIKTFGVKQIDNCGVGMGDSSYALPELLREQLGNLSASAYYLKSNYQFLQDTLKDRGVTI
jgi:hypothetical protein